MGDKQNEIMSKEHDGTSQPNVFEPLRAGMFGWDSSNLQYVKVAVDAAGKLKVVIE